MKSYLLKNRIPIAIAALFFILGLLRINDLSLYTDCTRYLIWGNSVAHGSGFVDNTQPAPEYFVINAPLYSVILIPPLVVFPLSLAAAKVWTLIIGFFAILLLYHWFCIHLGRTASLIAITLFAINPFTITLATEVLSETSFLCLLFAVYIILDKLKKGDTPRKQRAVILISILSVIILIREVSIALVLSTALFLYIKKHKKTAFISVGAAAFIFALWTIRNLGITADPESSQSPNLIFIFHHFVTPPNVSLFSELSQRIIINFETYSSALGGMILFTFPLNLIVNPSGIFTSALVLLSIIKPYMFILFVPALAFGIKTDLSRSKTAFARLSFIFTYLFIILLYPVHDTRFIFPLIPFVIFYLIRAIIELTDRHRPSPRIKMATGAAVFIFLFLPNILCIFEILRTNLSYRSNPANYSLKNEPLSGGYSYFSTPWSLLGNWIDRTIEPGAVIATPNKEIVPFASKQKYSEVNYAVPLPQFESLLRNEDVQYILAPTLFDDIVQYQTLIDESGRYRFKQVAKINKLNLFRVDSRLINKSYDSLDLNVKFNLDQSLDLFRYGRMCLKNEKYSDALSAFNALQRRFPRKSSIKYQLFITYSLMLDSAKVASSLQELYSYPMATSYAYPAQLHIKAMNDILLAKCNPDSQFQAVLLYDAARIIWDLGYQVQGYRIINEAASLDSANFMTLLWAFHYSTQMNDGVLSSEYLQELERIDSSNIVVKNFKQIVIVRRKISRSTDSLERSKLRLALSRIYDTIDLPEQALDEVQRAIGENSENKEAWLYLSDLFRKNRFDAAADRVLTKVHQLKN